MEAATPSDLTSWLDHDALLAAWPELFLPPHIRQAWQLRHPELSRAGAGPRVPPAA